MCFHQTMTQKIGISVFVSHFFLRAETVVPSTVKCNVSFGTHKTQTISLGLLSAHV